MQRKKKEKKFCRIFVSEFVHLSCQIPMISGTDASSDWWSRAIVSHRWIGSISFHFMWDVLGNGPIKQNEKGETVFHPLTTAQWPLGWHGWSFQTLPSVDVQTWRTQTSHLGPSCSGGGWAPTAFPYVSSNWYCLRSRPTSQGQWKLMNCTGSDHMVPASYQTIGEHMSPNVINPSLKLQQG